MAGGIGAQSTIASLRIAELSSLIEHWQWPAEPRYRFFAFVVGSGDPENLIDLILLAERLVFDFQSIANFSIALTG